MGIRRESDSRISVPESGSDLSGTQDSVMQEPGSVEMPEVVGGVEREAVSDAEFRERSCQALRRWRGEDEPCIPIWAYGLNDREWRALLEPFYPTLGGKSLPDPDK